MIVTFISQCEKKSKRPNSDIEYETIAQSLYAPSNSKKQHITNKVTRYFFESLFTQMTCTLIHVSISGLGLYKTRRVLDAFANRIGNRTYIFITDRTRPQAIDFSDRCEYVPVHSEISSLKSKPEKPMACGRLELCKSPLLSWDLEWCKNESIFETTSVFNLRSKSTRYRAQG